MSKSEDDAMRDLIAKEIWRYQECEEAYGAFDDDPPGHDPSMRALIKQTAIDQAELIRAVMMPQIETLRSQLEAAKAETNDVRKAANAEIDCLSRASQKEIESWQNERNHARADQEAAEAALANARSQLVNKTELTEAMLEAGAQALANDVWHPHQKLSSLSPSEAMKFKRQALLVLKAALTDEQSK